MTINKKEIISVSVKNSGYGTHTYSCKWMGEWEEQELIDRVDGSSGNYGGAVEVFSKSDDGIYTGEVKVYYD